MQRLFAIAFLTLRAAVRFRLVLMLSGVLLAAVIILPLIIKDDGTARGFTQILLTYTLSVITAVLGFSTLWLACGTLAREMEEAQMQMIAVKPIPRWQVWVGKWLGILMLNAILLTASGIALYVLMQYRATRLPEAQQTILRNEVMVARGSVKEPIPNYEEDVQRFTKARIAAAEGQPLDINAVTEFARERIKAQMQIVPPGYLRQWQLDLGIAKPFLKDQPLFLRTKFNVAQVSEGGTYTGLWEIGPTNNTAAILRRQMSLASDTFHEIELPPNVFDENGIVHVRFINQNQTAVLFPLEDGMELLYREGGFGLNFARGLVIILCWLSLLAALGLAAATFLSFPVAAFVSIGVLIVGMSSGTFKQIVEEKGISGVDHETGRIEKQDIVDQIAVPAAAGILKVLNLIREFSPVEKLSTGRSISWAETARAILQIMLMMGGVFAAIGISVFARRELANVKTFY
ncbi:MAG: ABC transporter permease [Verrucomicrobiota bacterium]|nr:ABC transporter permease [Verrucomicrobiota bacterium]